MSEQSVDSTATTLFVLKNWENEPRDSAKGVIYKKAFELLERSMDMANKLFDAMDKQLEQM